MSNYGSQDTKLFQKIMCNTPRDIIRYISTFASEDTMFEAVNLHENVNNSRFAFQVIVSSENEK